MTDETPPPDASPPPSPDADPPRSKHRFVAALTDRPWLARLGRAAGPLLILTVGLGLGSWLGSGAPENGSDGAAAPAEEATTMWTCSMHPQIRMDKPGQCPICGMDLVPLDAGDAGDEPAGRVTLSPRAQALAQVATTPVVRTEPRMEVRLLGRVEYDESRLRTVTPWTAGRIDELKVRVTGTRIRRGQAVAKLYSPEIYAAMRDLVLARRQAKALESGLHGSGSLASAALESSRQRLRLLGVPDEQIQTVERTGDAPSHFDVHSPFAGTVLERLVEEGEYVTAGTPLYNIADLSRVWIQIDAYESDLPHLRIGQEVEVEVRSLPDEVLAGKIAFIDPVVDPRERTTRVRVEVPNRDGRLRPGMFAESVIEVGAGEQHSQLVIPASAPLFTGRRSVVYVEVPDRAAPTFEIREVRLGPRAGPVYPVLDGLSEHERVVTHGAFVLDADLQLAGGPSMMTRPDDRAATETGIPVPPEFLSTIQPVFEHYLAAQQSLAADDAKGAREALGALSTALAELDPPGPRRAREAWRAVVSTMSGHAQHAAKSEEIGAIRIAFEHVSMQAEAILQSFGNPLETPVHVAFCPMAFDSKGARWVQSEEQVKNPYYGAAMLRCGEVKATVVPGESMATVSSPPPPGGAAPTHHH